VDGGTRRWAIGGAALVVLLLYPLVSGRDGFPLSTYPMFSTPKGTEAKIAHVIGRGSAGSATPLRPALLGTAEIMQASQIARNAAKDRKRAADLCTRVAENVAMEDDLADIVSIEVRTDTYDAIAYWQGDREPRASKVHAKCNVGGRS
jgi:hypothetical protein